MRSILFFTCLAILSITYGQEPYSRIAVVEIDTVTSPEVIRSTAQKWFVDTFKDSKEVIQMNDATTNIIVGKGWTEFGPNGELHYTIEVQCKEGRARVNIYNVSHKGRGFIDMGAGPIPATSLGAFFDHERCAIPQVGGMFDGEKAAERRMLRWCETGRPEIDARLDRTLASLVSALKVPKTASSTDW